MNTQQYLRQFKRHLRVVPKNIREEIVQDFEAILAEGEEQQQDLLERFGTPQELAAKYVEESDVELPWYSPVLKYGRNFLLLMGLGAILLAAVFYGFFAYFIDKRYFEYTDLKLAKTYNEFSNEVHLATVPASLAIEQAHVVLYSHSSPELLLRCRGKIEDKAKIQLQMELEQKNLVSIFRNACLVFVPEQSALSLSVLQSEINIIQPQLSLEIKGNQSSIALFSQDIEYSIELQARQSSVQVLPQETASPWRLSFDLYQSELEEYIPEIGWSKKP